MSLTLASLSLQAYGGLHLCLAALRQRPSDAGVQEWGLSLLWSAWLGLGLGLGSLAALVLTLYSPRAAMTRTLTRAP